jgi:hypothetical protein
MQLCYVLSQFKLGVLVCQCYTLQLHFLYCAGCCGSYSVHSYMGSSHSKRVTYRRLSSLQLLLTCVSISGEVGRYALILDHAFINIHNLHVI